MTEEKPTELRKPTAQILAIQLRIYELEKKMNFIEESLLVNTQLTRTIAENTKPLLDLHADLAAGTKFLCRCAIGIRFVLEMVKSYYMPVVIVCTFIFLITHNFQLPHWFNAAIQAVE